MILLIPRLDKQCCLSDKHMSHGIHLESVDIIDGGSVSAGLRAHSLNFRATTMRTNTGRTNVTSTGMIISAKYM